MNLENKSEINYFSFFFFTIIEYSKKIKLNASEKVGRIMKNLINLT